MGCGASAAGKYEKTSSEGAMKQFVAATTAQIDARCKSGDNLELDADLFKKVFVRKDGNRSPESIRGEDVEQVLEAYAKGHHELLEKNLKHTQRASALDLKAVETMTALEEKPWQYSNTILERLNVAPDGEVTRDAFENELRNLIESVSTGGRAPSKTRHLQRKVSKGCNNAMVIDRTVLEELWNKYDDDQSGTLEAEELLTLLLDYAKGCRQRLEELGMSKRGHIVHTADQKLQLNAMKHLEANANQFSQQLLPVMDRDSDGFVDKAEFLDRFADVWVQIDLQCKQAVAKD